MGNNNSKPETATPNTTEHQVPAGESSPTPQEAGGGCPMKRTDGSYSYDWRAMFRKSPHGPSGSRPLSKDNLKRGDDGNIVRKDAPPSSSSGGCPVKEYNVYSQPIDPRNQMPKVANQLPGPGQTKELSTSRVKSSIAKGGAEEGSTWEFPSPQQFFNALARKGKLGETKEEDMDSLVAVHNNMNEKTWARVLAWERVLNPSSQSNPSLLKFMGRPADLSPKALVKHYLLGHPLPYDRHDWTILRSDGTTIRYVIDYYHDDSRANESPESAFPDAKNHDATPSLLVDVRPALDSPLRAWDRLITMPYARHIEKTTNIDILPMAPTSEMRSQVTESIEVFGKIKESARQKQEFEDLANSISQEDAVSIAKSFAQVLNDCQKAQQKLQNSASEEEYSRASLDLMICMGKVICPLQHQALTKALNGDSSRTQEMTVEAALENITSCVAWNTQKRSAAKQRYPDAFQD